MQKIIDALAPHRKDLNTALMVIFLIGVFLLPLPWKAAAIVIAGGTWLLSDILYVLGYDMHDND